MRLWGQSVASSPGFPLRMRLQYETVGTECSLVPRLSPEDEATV